jgi:arylsulfatase A-like enzyme
MIELYNIKYMNMKNRFKAIVVVAFFGMTSLVKAQNKPNIIFIYADDLDADEINYTAADIDTWPTLSGAQFYKIGGSGKVGTGKLLTPHIDGLAKNGIVFNRFYVNATVCTPSRYCLMTGRFATHGKEFAENYKKGSQITLEWTPAILRNESNLPKELQKLGYRTGIIGKWHNLPNIGLQKPKHEITKADAAYQTVKANEKVIKNYYAKAKEYLSQGFGWDVVDRMEWGNSIVNLGWMCEGALNFIEESREEPFFLYLPLPVPHGQYKYGYNNLSRLDPRVTANGILDKIPTALPPSADVYKRLKENGVLAENVMAIPMDDYVGAVLKKLDELGLRENTLVIFTSDHGGRGKNSCYEGAARMPLFANWPGKINPGTTTSVLTANTDIVGTLIEVAGGTPAKDMEQDGHSFNWLLEGNSEPNDWRKSIFIEAGNSKGIVTKNWKYIANRVTPEIEAKMKADPGNVFWSGLNHHNYGTETMYKGYWDADQLYNLDTDLYEQKNLISEAQYQNEAKKMKAELKKYVSALPFWFGEFGK